MSSSIPPGIGPLPPAMPPELAVPSEEPENQRRRISKLEIVISALLAVGFVAVIAAVFMGHSPAVDRTFAIGSLKQMNLALIDFDSDYGRFPDATTIADVKATTHTTIPLGDRTSNELFRQLVAAGNTSERIFWAPSPGHRRKPNDILGSDALAKGECIHSYVAGLSTKDDPGAIIAMALMIPGTTSFDPVPYDNKAVVLRIDGSARPEAIKADTNEVIIAGKNLFDPSQPYWRGKTPDLKWPE